MAKVDLHGVLVRAIHRRKINELQEALASGVPLDKFLPESNHGQYLPLHYALDEETVPLEVVKALIDAGADVNSRTKQPVSTSPKYQSTPLTTYTPLMLAAQNGRPDLLKLLLDSGADPHAVFVGMRGGETPLIEFVCAGKGIWGEWCCAGTPGHTESLRLLLAKGLKPTIECLLEAARNGNPDMIHLLLKAGLNVNDLSAVSDWGTALHIAASEGRDDNVAALLQAGADVHYACPDENPYYPRQTALQAAQAHKKRKAVALLQAAAKEVKPTINAPPPLAASVVPTLWKRLEKALPSKVKKSLLKPPTKAELTKAAQAMDIPVKALAPWTYCGGQTETADGLLPGGLVGLASDFLLLSLKDAVHQWTLQAKLAGSGEFKGLRSRPDNGLRADWWNLKWIPLATDGGGDLLCLDYAPGHSGMPGQIILYRHDASERRRVAPFLAVLLIMTTDHWKA